MDDVQTLLAQLPVWGFGLVLVFSRVGAACMLLPGVGEAELPGTVRLGFTMALTALLLPTLEPLLPPVPAGPLVIGGMVMAEIAPRIPMRTAITRKVKGRRSARRTIHIGS